MVGATIVAADGTIVGDGWHQQAGTPHAEIHAIAAPEAGPAAQLCGARSSRVATRAGRRPAQTRSSRPASHEWWRRLRTRTRGWQGRGWRNCEPAASRSRAMWKAGFGSPERRVLHDDEELAPVGDCESRRERGRTGCRGRRCPHAHHLDRLAPTRSALARGGRRDCGGRRDSARRRSAADRAGGLQAAAADPGNPRQAPSHSIVGTVAVDARRRARSCVDHGEALETRAEEAQRLRSAGATLVATDGSVPSALRALGSGVSSRCWSRAAPGSMPPLRMRV